MDKMESFQKRPAGTTDWTALILWPPEPEAGARLEGHAGRSPSLLMDKMKSSQGCPVGTTDWTALILWPPEREAGARLEDIVVAIRQRS